MTVHISIYILTHFYITLYIIYWTKLGTNSHHTHKLIMSGIKNAILGKPRTLGI